MGAITKFLKDKSIQLQSSHIFQNVTSLYIDILMQEIASQSKLVVLCILEPVLCPYLLSSKGAGLLKSLLQHQVWQQEYSFTLTDLREEDRDLQNTISSQMALLDRLVC